MSITDGATIGSGDGLNPAEVATRVDLGRVNTLPAGPDRTLGQIIRANVLTPVNGIMLFLFVVVVVAGHWRDGLFVGVVLSNSAVGIVQEVRARRELAALEVLNETAANVIRDGARREIDVESIVVDDLLVIEPGHQVVVDGSVMSARGLEIDESLLTGESVTIHKEVGDDVRSGSFVVAGSGRFQATHVGSDSYATTLAAEAKQFSLIDSKLRGAVDRVLRWLLAIIPIASIMLLLSLLDSEDRWQDALQGTVGAAVAMVPDGLVLLTSVAFVSGAIELSRRKALAKQLASVETLARVDVLCLDKTGTITSGAIALADIVAVPGHTESDVRRVLAAMVASDPAPNATMAALGAAGGADDGWVPTAVEPFSSERKWTAASFEAGTFHLGAPDVLLAVDDPVLVQVQAISETGQRVLVVCRSPPGSRPSPLPEDREAMGIVILSDVIRPDAPETIDYFRAQGVILKIISGDNPGTVATIADRAGVPDAERSVDARGLVHLDEAALGEALEQHTVFGRVAPHQKQAMVRALQARGHVVAMTGDGVNDVLALKQADLGIAMGSGSPASRGVADIVLTDSSFASLPRIVDEGRKVINNVERVANLFLTKAAYAVVLTIVIGLAGIPFPLLPRQLTLIGTFSIGVPGFFLAMSPERDRVRDGFLGRVLRFSIPVGLAAGLASLAVYETARRADSVSLEEARTATTLTLLCIGLVVLAVVSRPLRPWKVALVVAMALSYSLIVVVPWLREYFQLDVFPALMGPVIAAAVAAAGAVAIVVGRLVADVRRDQGSTNVGAP